MAALNGLYIAHSRGADAALLQVDCMAVVAAVNGGSHAAQPKFRDRLRAVGVEFSTLRAKHVKAHNGTPDARSWANDWCDKQAYRCMAEARTAAKREQV